MEKEPWQAFDRGRATKTHPPDHSLDALAAALSTDPARFVLHLLGCETCREEVLRLLRQRTAGTAEPTAKILGWTGEWQAAAPVRPTRRTRKDPAPSSGPGTTESRALLALLLAHPVERRRVILAKDARFQTLGLGELLVDRSLASRPGGIDDGEQLGSLALELASFLRVGEHGPEVIADFRSRAWASIANARRMRSDLQGASEAMERAFSHLAEGTREPVREAALLALQGSLLRALRRLEDSKKVLNRAVEIYRAQGDDHLAGRSLLTLGTVWHVDGDMAEAIAVTRRALDLVDPEREPALVLCAWHNLIDDFAEAGRFSKAAALAAKMEPLYRQYETLPIRYRRICVAGKIARGLGKRDEAEKSFLEARDGFLALDVPYAAATASFYLAGLYSEQHRASELRSLAQQILPVFVARGILREALAALACLREAAAGQAG